MKAIHLSDWHSGYIQTQSYMRFLKLERDEDMELVLVTGDMLPNFNPMFVPGFETEQALRQYGLWKQIAAHFQDTWPNADIVAVPGNHDWCDYAIPGLVQSFDKLGTGTMEVRGKRFSGFRGVPQWTGQWHGEFNDRIIDQFIEELDFSADIFLTHAPPYRILDAVNEERHVGAVGLGEFFVNNPWIHTRYHLFGHVHECGGSILRHNGMIYSNAAGHFNVLDIK